MNLIQKISSKVRGVYSENEPEKVHSPNGQFINQKVYCKFIHNNHEIKLIGNYELGVKHIFVKDDPIYSIILSVPAKINIILFYPKSKFEKLFKIGGNKGVKSKYSSKRNSISDRLILSRRFENLMLSNNVYISTNIKNKSTVILRAVQIVPDINTLEELLEIITIISDKLK